jgi:ATP-dependent helicase HrpA
MARDERRLRRRLEGARKLRDKARQEQVASQLTTEIGKAEQRVVRRKAAVPKLVYPDALPVSQRRDEIAAAIRDHQVVIVAGETGSGKTTQLPKICLELGRGIRGTIGHTQPRRIAARTVAERIAEELGTTIGATVGYKVRFTDQVGEDSLVKLMTDGILLAEIGSDRMLRQYDTLIIDEAHERSLNVDCILGYLKQLLPRRPDLKVIITSATIDPERFSRHFDDAPIVEVSGRTYPVEVRYRPVVDPEDPDPDEDRDQLQAIGEAVAELSAEGPGDVLVFLSGEREIRDAADYLNKQNLRNTEVLPLYARLSAAEQHRVFQRHTGRRIVLATNVAETSLTVPGIKYVIDPGTARISRYSTRLKVQRLPIERISQASANQRKGRCGRTSDGICIRLYTEDDFDSRPEFTDPEILRTNLASVILQMTALNLGDIAAFGFLDPPDKRNIAAGVQLLQELGALDAATSALTPVGRTLSQLPVDPRLGRMILEADKNGCVREVTIIVAALSIQDPRERPVEKQEAASEKHRRFTEPHSDFLAYLNLWAYLTEQQKELSGNQFRKLCRTDFLNYLRVREWQDLYGQLRQISRGVGISPNMANADPDKVHISLLSGLLSQIGLKDPEKNDYAGPRNAHFSIFPGSGLFKKQPRWVMAAELVETSRLWARTVAAINPDWVEPLAEHLISRTYSEPHWDADAGAVMAYEKVTLYGLPVVPRRRVNYGRIEPELSRELFIRYALVDGEWETHHRFFHENRKLLAEVEDLENRARRRDILVDDEALFDFYDRRIGSEVVSGRHFDSWWKNTRRDQPDLLNFEKSMLINDPAKLVSAQDYPDTWRQGDLAFHLSYQFEPGTDADGVTVHIPLAVLNQVSAEGFDWQVPGLRRDVVAALIRSLPKVWRRNFVPAPDVASAVVAAIDPEDGELLDALEDELSRMTGLHVPREAWDLTKVPDHLRVTFRVVDRKRTIGEGKDLNVLKERLRTRMREEMSAGTDTPERTGLQNFEVVPKVFERRRGGHVVKAFPALSDESNSVSIRLYDTEAEQQRAMAAGTRRLLLLKVPSPVAYVNGRLNNRSKLALSKNPHRDVADMLQDCISCAADKLIADGGGPAWEGEGFEALLKSVRAALPETTLAVVRAVETVLTAYNQVEAELADLRLPVLKPAVADIRQQLDGLVFRGFVTATGWQRLGDLPRYLTGISHRIERLRRDVPRDTLNLGTITYVTEEYQRRLNQLPAGAPVPAALAEVRWMIEELRIGLFAQTLRTAYPISEKRILRAIDSV